MITSPANKKIREVQNLNRKASYRRETGLFPAEGERMFLEIPEERIRGLFVSEHFLQNCRETSREKLSRIPHEVMEVVADSVFPSLSDTRTPQGILCLVKAEEHSLEELLSAKNPNLLVLETIQDPGNLGTMLRAGEAAGLTGIVADRGTADLYNPKVIRSTMGSIFRVPMVYVDDLQEALRAMKQRGIALCAAHLQGSVAYDQVSYTGPNAFLIGNEANGLTEETAALSDLRVRIPMLGRVESLNAAVAASVLLFELSRQRRALPQDLA